MQFQERVVQFPKRMKIVKVNASNEAIVGEAEILVNIVHDEGSVIAEGTPINAENLNKIDRAAQNAVEAANEAIMTANSASVSAAQAVMDSSNAISTANQADAAATQAAANAVAAITTANTAKSTAEEALAQTVQGLGTKVYVGGQAAPVSSVSFTADPQTQLDGKATKATTLAGYGIIDAYIKTEVDSKISSILNSSLKARFDETTQTLYLTNDGSEA